MKYEPITWEKNIKPDRWGLQNLVVGFIVGMLAMAAFLSGGCASKPVETPKPTPYILKDCNSMVA